MITVSREAFGSRCRAIVTSDLPDRPRCHRLRNNAIFGTCGAAGTVTRRSPSALASPVAEVARRRSPDRSAGLPARPRGSRSGNSRAMLTNGFGACGSIQLTGRSTLRAWVLASLRSHAGQDDRARRSAGATLKPGRRATGFQALASCAMRKSPGGIRLDGRVGVGAMSGQTFTPHASAGMPAVKLTRSFAALSPVRLLRFSRCLASKGVESGFRSAAARICLPVSDASLPSRLIATFNRRGVTGAQSPV